jgi:hypothetical protein
VLLIWLALAPLPVRAEDADTPHHMTKADGELDMEKCGVCHNEDMSLQRSKLDTCTLCHAQTVHAGADEHVRAAPAAVKRALGEPGAESPALPLGDDGHIYCGTCHLFHDPAVMQENWLAQGWLPRATGLPIAVRDEVLERWGISVQAEDKQVLGRFATTGTRQLRLPVENGQLCRSCHGAVR